MLNTLENLFNLARERKNSPQENSYTNKLLSDKSLIKPSKLDVQISDDLTHAKIIAEPLEKGS